MKTGQIILVSSNGFLPDAIKFFMNIYRKRMGLKPRRLYSHVAVVVDLWGTQWIAEASAKGVRVIPYPGDYVRRHNCLVMDWKIPLSESEQRLFSRTAIEYTLRVTRYDVLNFWYQIKFILTGRWKGPEGDESKRRLYCSEFAAVVMDRVRNSFHGRTWDKNPLDIELCQDIEALYYDEKREKQ